MESEASEDEFGIVETSDGKEDDDANFLEHSAASPVGEGPEGNGMHYRVQEDQDDGPEPRGTARDTIADAWSLSDDSSAAPEDEANGAHARLPEPHPHPAAAIQFISERAGRHGTTATFASEADEWAKAAFQSSDRAPSPGQRRPQNAKPSAVSLDPKFLNPDRIVGIIGNERARKVRSIKARSASMQKEIAAMEDVRDLGFHGGDPPYFSTVGMPRSSARA